MLAEHLREPESVTVDVVNNHGQRGCSRVNMLNTKFTNISEEQIAQTNKNRWTLDKP